MATAKRYLPVLLVVLVIGGAAAIGLRSGGGEEKQPQAAPLTQFGGPPRKPPPAPTSESEAAAESKESVKDLFGHNCGTCHTLAAAGTDSPIGPKLDGGDYSAQRVRDQIATGSTDNAMPKDILTGRSADRVARFVARATRR